MAEGAGFEPLVPLTVSATSTLAIAPVRSNGKLLQLARRQASAKAYLVLEAAK